jgi:uncharacterized protein (TIRG00374 family)
MPDTSHHPKPFTWGRFATWFSGFLVLSGLILLVTHVSELEQFATLLRRAEPQWLALALLLQMATYVSASGVWYLSLRRLGQRHSLRSLVPLGLAKLFSDQAMPSGGISGTAFFITALNRRGVPTHMCMAILLLSLVTYYAAYLLATLTTLFLLWFVHHAIERWIIGLFFVFCLLAVGTPAVVLLIRNSGRRELPLLLLRIPGLSNLMTAFIDAPTELLRSPALMLSATLLHGSVFVLDTVTLWVALQGVGVECFPWTIAPAFMLASMVATLGPIPLGLGTFEVTCVSMLHVLGIPVEAALTATLILRGFTLWLPMVPGMWLMRRALR